jgi:hypothetical protein
MKPLVLATALIALAAVIQPATAQTLYSQCKTTTGNGTAQTACTASYSPPPYTVPSSLTPSQQVTAYGVRHGHEVPSSLTPSQQVTAYGARYH